MPLTCDHCGAENRESAKFCRQCAGQLVPLSAPTQPLELEAPMPRRRRHSGRRRSHSARPPLARIAGTTLVGLAALLVFVSLGWSGRTPDAGSTPAETAAADASPRDGSAPDKVSLTTPAPESAAVARAAEAVGALQAPDAAAALAESVGASAIVAAAAAAATAAADTTTTKRPAQAPRKARAAPPQAPASEQVAATVAADAAVPVRAVAAEPPVVLCQGSRFLAHAMCMQNECSKPGLRQHPQCQRMRELQDSLHQPDQGG